MIPLKFHKEAFEPFFDTPISVSGERPCGQVAGQYTACLFDEGFAAPLNEVDVDTQIHTYYIQVPAEDWLERKPPQIGDRIVVGGTTDCSPTLPMLELAVSRVDNIVGEVWSLTATEVEH